KGQDAGGEALPQRPQHRAPRDDRRRARHAPERRAAHGARPGGQAPLLTWAPPPPPAGLSPPRASPSATARRAARGGALRLGELDSLARRAASVLASVR